MIKKYILLSLGLAFSFASESFSAQEKEHKIFSILCRTDLAQNTQYRKVRRMLFFHPKLVQKRNSSGGTPLHAAATRGLCRAAQLLLDYGADVHAKNTNGLTPLHCGATDADMVSLLVRAGAHVDARNVMQATPLHIACLCNSFDDDEETIAAVRLLLRLGADIEAVVADRKITPLHFATNRTEKKMRFLLRAGAYTDREDNKGLTPFEAALAIFEPRGYRRTAYDYRKARISNYMTLEILLRFGIPLRPEKEIAALEASRLDSRLYEDVQLVIEKMRKFWRDNIPGLERHYLGEDYQHLQLPDALREMLLDFIATPALPAENVVEPGEPVCAQETEESQQKPQQNQNLELEQAHDNASGRSLPQHDAAEVLSTAATSTDNAEDVAQDAEASAHNNSYALTTSCLIL